MGKIFVLMGKSATGKDTIYKLLLDELDLKPLVTYTTRPKRAGEVNGREYYFVNEEEMKQFEEQGLILECRHYNTDLGIWYYFTVKDHQIDSDSNFLTINTIDGFNQLKQSNIANNIYPIYIEVPYYDRLLRAINREHEQLNPNYNELCRRFLIDKEDFKEEKLKDIKHRYINIELHRCVQEIIKDIKDILS